jgi:uncharacterized protein (TIGR02266 family)
VALKVRYAGSSGVVEQVVGNISLGGLRVQGPISDTVGAQIDLTLSMPHLRHDVRVHGEVMWVEREAGSDEATVGVRFLDLDPRLNVMLCHIFRDGLPE